jgi:PAS domain S-box-containing protein
VDIRAAILAGEDSALPERLRAMAETEVLLLGLPTRDELRSGFPDADCVLVEAGLSRAVVLARWVHEADAAVQEVLVIEPAERARAQRSLLFAPGLGEVWLAEPGEVTPELLERAAAVTRQRRRYQVTRRRLEGQLPAADPQRAARALISDAYLAALLQVLPDPVLSIDEGDRVLTWNPAAERLFGRTADEATGRPVLDVLAPDDRPALELALAEGARREQHLEIRYRTAAGRQRTAEVAILPVEAAGYRVRSLLMHDVTESRRSRQALEAQAAQLASQAGELQERTRALQDALAARGRFYANMSHELRTPMNAIIGYNSLLLDEVYGPLRAEQANAVRRVARAAAHLLELLDDVLDLAKIEAGRIELREEPVRIPALLHELADTVRPMAERQGSELVVEGEGEGPAVATDPRRVRQILLNLLSNAVKFGEGRPVRLAWEGLPDGGASVKVIDQGRGIDPADQARIFEEFVQVEAQEGRGTGLGLSISQRLAQLLGGRLELTSAPGRGSEFRLTLPPALPPRDPALPA